ncbi:MAG: efflux RND transporter periplasmic adaptor subunit, partial [Dehalococcoidia bacterium]
MSLRVKVYGFLALVLLLSAGGYFLKRHFAAHKASPNSSAQGRKNEKEITPVELAAAKRDKISSYLSSTTNLRALREVDVAAQTDGVVRRVLVEEGDVVKEGQLLCQLDDREAQIRLQLAREKLAQAKWQLEKARIRKQKAAVLVKHSQEEVRRLQHAYDAQLISEKEYAAEKYGLEELQHDERVSSSEIREFTHRVEELQAEVKQAQLDILHTRITAPFGGHITERKAELGGTVRNLDPLFKLSAFSPLYADVYLSEREAHEVKPKQAAFVRLGVDESL